MGHSRKQISLNDLWELHPGTKDSFPPNWEYRVQVPSLVDCAEPKYNWQSNDYHWYRKTFRLDTDIKNQVAVLTIEQAMFGTEVWLNGKHLGGDIACYTSQEYRCSDVIRYDDENELIVRVGSRNTLPPESAVGKDQERETFIPGIWGDVYLTLSGNPRVKLVQVIPHIDIAQAEVRVTIENVSAVSKDITVAGKIRKKKSLVQRSKDISIKKIISPKSEITVTLLFSIDCIKLWSPDNPFLHGVEIAIEEGSKVIDHCVTTFGMREFKIVGSNFYLNGKRIFLKGGNIAFHRFLSDPDRGLLPWNPEWIKKILIDIPKAHNFNFFRNHLGQMYNRWYDIADEYGMLLQNEWQFWTTSGTKEQITKEFTRWLQDNWNHPSIIIWDPINESSDDIVQKEIIPKMKELDPTRPWESVDFNEQHPYIYSLGPVLNDRKFGFTTSLEEIKHSPTPSVVNEFLWWWLDRNYQPTSLTKDVIERWLGKDYTQEELVNHQSFLAQELVELFRRMRVDAIQPFVYLSNNDGPTGNWFAGNIKDLQPKPVLSALKNAFSPLGISLELWDRHFFTDEERQIRLYIFNDEPDFKECRIHYGIVDESGNWVSQTEKHFHMEGTSCIFCSLVFKFPAKSGNYFVRAELFAEKAAVPTAFSQKIAHIFGVPELPAKLEASHIGFVGPKSDINEFLSHQNMAVRNIEDDDLQTFDAIIITEGQLKNKLFQIRFEDITQFVNSGKSLIVIEPDYGVEGIEIIEVVRGIHLTIDKRMDADRGGYDSYVFAEDHSHPLWKGIHKEHLKMFNGGYGGEVVSQHDVTADGVSKVFARCGLKLKTAAVFEIPFGKGKVIISRLQLKGRLVNQSHTSQIYDRRVDPVIQQYLLNLLEYANS
ncbi:MAG: glycoside hydrolase family 2 TIM barrel-domain containing protein [Bacteroidota bacterium]|nr:glycoside hydrolase family 2 TIM barrel-domain containing protein [Bacteroidota bacterium]